MRCAVLLATLAGTMLFAGESRATGAWYVSGSAGGYFREDTTASTTIGNGNGGAAAGTVARTFDPGFVLNLAGGYRWPIGLRSEVELGYAQYSTTSVTPMVPVFANVNGVTFNHATGSNLHRMMATANLFYDLPIGGRFVPYVGAGLGAIHVQAATISFTNSAGGTFTSRLGAGNDGVALAEVGVTIAITDGLSIVPAYRYIHEFGGVANNGAEVAHVLKVGMRYAF
jgi:opacity protein-like surface antigen